MAAAASHACIVCSSPDLQPVLKLQGVPLLCNQLVHSFREAVAVPRGDIDLVFCRNCGHSFNRIFDPDLLRYEATYENSLHFSPRYRTYAEATVRRLVDRYGIRNKRIVEIGCGRGDFLRLLCAEGESRGIGYDPSAGASTDRSSDDRVTIIGELFQPGAAQFADLICCRHVLEHIWQPIELVQAVGDALRRKRGVAFFEVPNASLVFDQLSLWDIIYEHVSYFSRNSLITAFRRAGLFVQDAQSAFGGQFLWVEARASGDGPDLRPGTIKPLQTAIDSFADRADRLLRHWRKRIEDYRRDDVRLVPWGAGSKGAMFLNLLQLRAPDGIPHVVDINPRKTGCHVVGTGQMIVGPEFLRRYRPDVILVLNPEYRQEIATTLRDLGVRAEIELVVESPPAGDIPNGRAAAPEAGAAPA